MMVMPRVGNHWEGLEGMMASIKPIEEDQSTKCNNEVMIDGMEHMMPGKLTGNDFVGIMESTTTNPNGVSTSISYRINDGLRLGREMVVSNSNVTEIDWSLFPVRKIESKHVLTFASRTHSLDEINEELLATKKKELVNTRNQIREFVRRYIQYFFLQGFKEIAIRKGQTELLKKMNSFDDILQYHRENCDTTLGQELIGYMLFGYWDVRKGWEKLLEKRWMDKMNMKYKDKAGEGRKGEVSNWLKGSIAKIIMEVKETQVKRVRKAGMRKNIKVSKIRRGSKEIKNGRRKKGEFLVQSLKQVQNVPTVTQTDIDHAMEEKMKKAALKCGMGYDQFACFLKNLVEDNSKANREDGDSDESSESTSDSDESIN